MTQTKKYKISLGVTLAVAILYVLLPTDFVPDAIPALGWIDDIIAILLAIANAIRLGVKIRQSGNKNSDTLSRQSGEG